MSESRTSPSPGRSALWFLLVGIIIRLIALNQPLVDAHTFRQTQTALMTRGMLEQPGLPMGAVATWRGDLPARLILELPLYNYLVIPVYRLTGHLDQSGKLVSVLLWVFGFLVLQRIWRRCLTPTQTFWANLLFVFSPLSVFFGQAFMPEMLIQLIAFGFLLALLRYREKPARHRFVLAASIGLVGLLVKGPEILHLYLIAGIVLLEKEGWRSLRVPVYWLVAIISLVAVNRWAHVMDVTNIRYFPQWTSSGNLTQFIGKPLDHLNIAGYLRAWLYLTLLVFAPVGLPFVLAGAWRLFRVRPWGFPAWWVLSIIFFFVFWSGPVPRGQSYYTLPALAPCALLFGIGVDWALSRCFASALMRRWAAALFLVVLLPALAAGCLYLFRPDRVILESTRWIREHTRPDDLILLKANHRIDMFDYPGLAPFPYYAQRRFWVYSPGIAATERQRALETSKYALVTLPPAEVSVVEQWRRRLKREHFTPENIDPILEQAGFQPIYTNAHFMVFAR